MYLNPLALLLHIQPRTFMHIVGVVEIVLGIVVLTRYTPMPRTSSWFGCGASPCASPWTVSAIGIHRYSAVYDIEISLAAFALAVLSKVSETAVGRAVLESNTGIAHRSVT
jgi:hypothetical protein